MIDTHIHIYLPEFDEDRNAMLGRAVQAGVKKMLLPNIDSSSIAAMLSLCSINETNCLPMMGLHPCSVNETYEKELESVEQYLSNTNYKFYGVGECGLDYYWDKTFVAEQKIAFEIQIQFAKKYQLPLSIHSREATDDCITLIEKHYDENLHGVFHCFTGDDMQLQKIIDLNFYAGIGGVVTFKNGGLDKLLKPEHLSHLVLETDAPYLAPVPYRGKRNEPGYLQYIVKRLSEVLQLTEEEIISATTINAQKVFRV